jgi:hypothetical protein
MAIIFSFFLHFPKLHTAMLADHGDICTMYVKQCDCLKHYLCMAVVCNGTHLCPLPSNNCVTARNGHNSVLLLYEAKPMQPCGVV